uniref:Protein AAR2 homolog n=1 Tax=Amphimedon queenslandica TaxID=400682 RepID=A0A1X7UUX0_AMPQE
MDNCLGPYPYEHLKKWLALTNYITPSLVESTCSGYFAGVGEFSHTIKSGGGEGGKRKQEGTTDVECTYLRFSVIPKFKYPPGASPTEISHHSLDLSYTLEQLILGYNGKAEEQEGYILGELQLSFVYFLVGQVYGGFEQWKTLVRVLCLSDSALSAHPHLFINFMTVLHFQLREVPEQFFVDIISSDNFLTSTLQVFFTNIQEGDSLNSTLKEKAAMFKTSLSKRFQFDFTTELQENMPMIVNEHDT